MLKSKLNRRAHAKLATRKKKCDENNANILSPSGVNDFANDFEPISRVNALIVREKRLARVRNAPFIMRTIHKEIDQNSGHDYNSVSTSEKSEDTPITTNICSEKENIDPNFIQREWNGLPTYPTRTPPDTPKKVQMKSKATQQNNNNILNPTNVNVDITDTYPIARATNNESSLKPVRRRILRRRIIQDEINDSLLETSRLEDEGLIDRIEGMFLSSIEGIEDSFASMMPLCAGSNDTGPSCLG